jgi:long-chain fatty acid transport protein
VLAWRSAAASTSAGTCGLDAVYSHVFASDVTVTPQEAAVPRINPVKGNPTQTASVNGGTYAARADVLGVGMQYLF